jgi:hypothetical protein
MLTFLAIVLFLFFTLAIVGTFWGMCKGEPFAWLNWFSFSGEWLAIIGSCLTVIFHRD